MRIRSKEAREGRLARGARALAARKPTQAIQAILDFALQHGTLSSSIPSLRYAFVIEPFNWGPHRGVSRVVHTPLYFHHHFCIFQTSLILPTHRANPEIGTKMSDFFQTLKLWVFKFVSSDNRGGAAALLTAQPASAGPAGRGFLGN